MNSDKERALIELNRVVGVTAMRYHDILSPEEAALVLATVAGSLIAANSIAANSGSSTIQLDASIQKLKGVLEDHARHAHSVMGRLGIN